jgi:hypothetical protein
MPRVTKRLLLSITLISVALAGCSSGRRTDPAAEAAAAAGPPPSVQASGSPDPETGCPVDIPTLEKAFKANGLVVDNVVLGKGLKDPSCYQGYATALTQPENVNTAVVVFLYDAPERVWGAVIGGGESVCPDTVPLTVRPHLRNC